MAIQAEDARGEESTSSGSDELLRDSFVPVNTAVSVRKIVAESRKSPKLLDRGRALIPATHYSLRTERIYVFWIKRFIFFHGKRHPESMGKCTGSDCLATAGEVAASTRHRALAAMLFLYKEILQIKLP